MNKPNKGGKCKYCGKEFETHSLGGHVSRCKLNPNYEKNIKPFKNAWIGRHHTQETKERIRKKHFEFMKNNFEKTPFAKSKGEELFEAVCKKRELDKRFLIIKERAFYPYFLDFAFEDQKIDVEVDGKQHEQFHKEHDRKRNEHLRKNGWRVYRIEAAMLCGEITANAVIDHLLEFIGSSCVQSNSIGIKSHKDTIIAARIAAKKKMHEEKDAQKLTNHSNRMKMLELSNIDPKQWGSITKIAKLWNVSHTEVKRILQRTIK